MSGNGPRNQTKNTPSSKQQPDSTAYDHHMSWSMRWFFAIVAVLIYPLSAIIILKTGNPSIPTLISAVPPILFFAKSLIPMDDKTYNLRVKRIEANAQAKAQKQAERRHAFNRTPEHLPTDDSILQHNAKPSTRQKLYLVQRDEHHLIDKSPRKR